MGTECKDDTAGGLPGDLRRIAEVAGTEAAVRIALAFRGTYLYVPGLDVLQRIARDEKIRAEYDGGKTGKVISREYGLSERMVWRILNSPPTGIRRILDELLKEEG